MVDVTQLLTTPVPSPAHGQVARGAMASLVAALTGNIKVRAWGSALPGVSELLDQCFPEEDCPRLHRDA